MSSANQKWWNDTWQLHTCNQYRQKIAPNLTTSTLLSSWSTLPQTFIIFLAIFIIDNKNKHNVSGFCQNDRHKDILSLQIVADRAFCLACWWVMCRDVFWQAWRVTHSFLVLVRALITLELSFKLWNVFIKPICLNTPSTQKRIEVDQREILACLCVRVLKISFKKKQENLWFVLAQTSDDSHVVLGADWLSS